jgi:hypothetical protein
LTASIVIPAFVVLLVSFGISAWSAWKHPRPDVATYLFAGNNRVFALSSSLGSVMSMAVSFTALLSAGYVFGWQVTVSLVLGAALGLAALLRFLRNPTVTRALPLVLDRRPSGGVSYIALAGDLQQQSYAAHYIFFIGAYGLMIAIELAVLRGILATMLPLPHAEIYALLFMITFVCYAYVFVGGFRGVLITDYFQLLILLWFAVLLLLSIEPSVAKAIPAPTHGRLPSDARTLLRLHAGVCVGAFGWTFASVDQWYRTAGTLAPTSARRILYVAVALACVASMGPLFAGSLAHTQLSIPSYVTNRASLFILTTAIERGTRTFQFVFAMALVCAALTTMNTYIITIQQLYYEASVRCIARSPLAYLVEYVFKWKQVRGVALGIVSAAFVGSFLIDDRSVYAVGVAALSAFIFGVPLLALSTCKRDGGVISRVASSLSSVLAVGVASFPFALYFCRRLVGSLTLHLYLIPIAAAAAASIGCLACLVYEIVKRLVWSPKCSSA